MSPFPLPRRRRSAAAQGRATTVATAAAAAIAAALLTAATPGSAAGAPAPIAPAPVLPAYAPAHAPGSAPAQTADPHEALFGEGDPQNDAVWRQSFALLGQDAAGYTPAAEAVDWLLAQQCEDGSFLSFRPDPEAPCDDVTAADSNATSAAAQALAALGGHDEAVGRAVRWLAGVQNEDGGWSYNPGAASDANSTALAIGAFTAAGEDPAETRRDGSSPFDALASWQLGCDAANEDERGAFAWQPDQESGELFASDLATADAVLASYGAGLLVDPADEGAGAPTPLDCGGEGEGETEGGDAGDGPTEETPGEATEGATEEAEPEPSPERASASAGAAHLADALSSGNQHLVSTPPGGEEQPDYMATARTVLALAAGGHEEEWRGAFNWLADNHHSWTGWSDSPTAVGTLMLVARVADVDVRDFGGNDLLSTLDALGPAPEEGPGVATDAAGEDDDSGSGGGALLWMLGVGLAIGVAIGVWLSFRRRRAQGTPRP
ncbi:prenyltransferase/squalene oxidase repeat-containing protein [Streptomyces radicis]|uniref:prenyltransferase/squalene oxidase repeat-containing protein n=1 Tax=Streptomyces radicis TaxID=1750517 RepID=UPI001E50E8B8|nr:prenyltransferase/squalene oxidase repeat-containing protein [Streptomyces radicis]